MTSDNVCFWHVNFYLYGDYLSFCYLFYTLAQKTFFPWENNVVILHENKSTRKYYPPHSFLMLISYENSIIFRSHITFTWINPSSNKNNKFLIFSNEKTLSPSIVIIENILPVRSYIVTLVTLRKEEKKSQFELYLFCIE